LKRELRVLKAINPGIPILVVGPSDMSVKEKDRYQTYPSLEKVRDAMREASTEMGCAFWDMYEAMGGRNSMPSWVFADPPLAVSDFVHFNSRGARLIAEMMYNAIIYEYRLWEEEQKQLSENIQAPESNNSE
jgi:lysophospholipase L1-like esterase